MVFKKYSGGKVYYYKTFKDFKSGKADYVGKQTSLKEERKITEKVRAGHYDKTELTEAERIVQEKYGMSMRHEEAVKYILKKEGVGGLPSGTGVVVGEKGREVSMAREKYLEEEKKKKEVVAAEPVVHPYSHMQGTGRFEKAAVPTPTQQFLSFAFPHPEEMRQRVEKAYPSIGPAAKTATVGVAGLGYGFTRYVTSIPYAVTHPIETGKAIISPETYARYGTLLKTHPGVVFGEAAAMFTVGKGVGKVTKGIISTTRKVKAVSAGVDYSVAKPVSPKKFIGVGTGRVMIETGRVFKKKVPVTTKFVYAAERISKKVTAQRSFAELTYGKVRRGLVSKGLAISEKPYTRTVSGGVELVPKKAPKMAIVTKTLTEPLIKTKLPGKVRISSRSLSASVMFKKGGKPIGTLKAGTFSILDFIKRDAADVGVIKTTKLVTKKITKPKTAPVIMEQAKPTAVKIVRAQPSPITKPISVSSGAFLRTTAYPLAESYWDSYQPATLPSHIPMQISISPTSPIQIGKAKTYAGIKAKTYVGIKPESMTINISKSAMHDITKAREKTKMTPKEITKMKPATITKTSPKTMQKTMQKTKEMTKMVTKAVTVPVLPPVTPIAPVAVPPLIIMPPLPLWGPRPKRMGAKPVSRYKPRIPTARYKPSLAGLHIGKVIGKAPKVVTGAGIRFEIKKRKKRRKK